MTILETETILSGLGIDVLEVLALAEGFALRDPAAFATYVPAVRMMCDMFRGMTTELIDALEQVEDMDGSEVRPEWAPALRKAVIKRVVQEIHAIARRRSIAYDFSLSS